MAKPTKLGSGMALLVLCLVGLTSGSVPASEHGGDGAQEANGADDLHDLHDQGEASIAAGPVIAIDPGHGGREPGAVHRTANGTVDLLEKDANLRIALALEELLSAQGYRPVLTRHDDTQVNVPPRDLNGDGRIDGDDDLQARVDIANEAGAELLLSIHNNGSSDPRVRGTSTWYCAEHARGPESRVLAQLVQDALVTRLRARGYDEVVDAGFRDDPPLRKPYGHLFLVGPETPRVARASAMPGVVGESLYVTNNREAALLMDAAPVEAIAQAYADAVDAFFVTRPGGS